MFDAIVVLGYKLLDDGSLDAIAKSRVKKAADLFHKGFAPRIIFTGKHNYLEPKRFVKSEARAFQELALSLGVPADAMFLEEESVDTIGNVYFTRFRFLEPNGWRRVLVVTSEYHGKRSKYVVDKLLGGSFATQFVVVPNGFSLEQSRLRQVEEDEIFEQSHEWLGGIASGDVSAIQSFIALRHPKYARKE